MCSNYNPKGVGATPWMTCVQTIEMFTDYKPTVGFDEYFCSETARPRDDLATLLTSLGQLGLPELNRSHDSDSQLLPRLGLDCDADGSQLQVASKFNREGVLSVASCIGVSRNLTLRHCLKTY